MIIKAYLNKQTLIDSYKKIHTKTPMLFTRYVILILSLFLVSNLLANNSLPLQTFQYDWSESRALYPLEQGQEVYPAIIQKYTHSFEYYYDESGKLKVIELVHKVIRVNNQEAIQEYAKVRIPTAGTKVLKIKARAINQNGEVINLDGVKQIKELNSSQGEVAYKIFAVEGVKKGGEIEFFYMLESEYQISGKLILQSKIPTKNVSFKIISPENLLFDTKTYNGLANGKCAKNTYKNKNIFTLQLDEIPALQGQELFNYQAHLQRIHFRLARKKDVVYPLLTWDDIALSMSKVIYQNNDKKTNKALLSLKNRIFPSDCEDWTQEMKIKAIDAYIKSYIRKENVANSNFEDLKQIIDKKYANELGMVKLYAQLFELLNIEHQLVLTSNKKIHTFDSQFAAWEYLHTYLFYFSNQKTFLAPLDYRYPYNVVPFDYANQDGLFIKKIALGNQISALAHTQHIPALNASTNYIKTQYKLVLNADLSSSSLDAQRTLAGYNLFTHENKTQGKQSQKEYFYMALKSEAAFSNPSSGASHRAYFKAHLDFTSLIEKAGDTYLLKIGNLIDSHPKENINIEEQKIIEKEYAESFQTIIQFEIPKGYKIANLEKIKSNYFYTKKGKNIASFSSDYLLDNGKLSIIVREEYYQNTYQDENLKVFKAINAASQAFNNFSLVILSDKER